jgi:hypothetical protein
MLEADGRPLTAALEHWHDFYILLGTASATLVGLLFVAATVGAGSFSAGRRAPQRMFLSASVVNFSTILTACLILLAPAPDWLIPGLLITACGGFGLSYCALTWRDSVHEGLSASIDLEDRIWYLALPFCGYLTEAGSGIALVLRREVSCVVLATSLAMLLVTGIHNAWDITIWSITRPRP